MDQTYFNKRLIMVSEDKQKYNDSKVCWICKQVLNTDKVKDYCHVTGKFASAAHKCNLKLRIPRKLSINFHNLQGYDGHIIFKKLNNFDVDVAATPKGIDKCCCLPRYDLIQRHHDVWFITCLGIVTFYCSDSIEHCFFLPIVY